MRLLLLPVIPLVAAGIGAMPAPPWVRRLVTAAGGVAVFALTLQIALQVAHHAVLTALPDWIGVNPLAAVVLLLQGFVAMTAGIYSSGYVARITVSTPAREKWYHINLNLFVASLLLVPLLLQPALAWVTVELTTVLSIFLVALDDTRQALEAAWKYAVITIMGATAAALGIFLLLWALARHSPPGASQTWAAIVAAAPHMPVALLGLAFVLVVVGFGSKVGLVPLHAWLPDAHSQAPTPVCALLSGVEVSTALYVIMRLWPAFNHAAGVTAGTWAVLLGLVSVGVAALLVVQVRDYKRLFAFSTVEHMGLILAALGFGPLGAYASIYQLLAHGLAKSFAFYATGGILLSTNTREIAQVHGVMRWAPGLGWTLLFAGLAVAGAPPFAVFLSEFAIVRSAFAVHDYWALVLLLGFVLTAFAGITWQLTRMLFGPPSVHRGTAPPRSMTGATALAAIPVLALGLYLPVPLHHLIVMAAAGLGR